MKKDIQYTVVPQTFPKRSTIIMQYMTPGSILHITFYYVSNGIFFQHSSIQAFLLHDHWQSERGMESGFCQERDSHESVHGVSFRFKTSQQVKIVVLNKCPLLKEPLLHHLLTPPPYSLASVGQAVIQGTVQSVGWHSWQFFGGQPGQYGHLVMFVRLFNKFSKHVLHSFLFQCLVKLHFYSYKILTLNILQNTVGKQTIKYHF